MTLNFALNTGTSSANANMTKALIINAMYNRKHSIKSIKFEADSAKIEFRSKVRK